jgi:hypothetical protein
MATIRKIQGRYHTQVRKNGKNITKTFTNKSDALKWAKEQEVKIEQGTFTTKEVKKTEQVVTLAFLLERWEKEVLTSLKSWSVERYKVALVTRELGKFPLDQITSTFLASYRDRRLSLASNQTVKHELGLIRRAMKKESSGANRLGIPFNDGGVRVLGVISAVTANRIDAFVAGYLVQHIGQHLRVTDSIRCHLNRPNFQGFSVNAQMNLAPLPTVLGAMLLGFPFAFAQHFYARTVHQQMQAIGIRPIGNTDL